MNLEDIWGYVYISGWKTWWNQTLPQSFFAPPKSYPRYSQGIAPKIANPGNPDVLQWDLWDIYISSIFWSFFHHISLCYPLFPRIFCLLSRCSWVRCSDSHVIPFCTRQIVANAEPCRAILRNFCVSSEFQHQFCFYGIFIRTTVDYHGNPKMMGI